MYEKQFIIEMSVVFRDTYVGYSSFRINRETKNMGGRCLFAYFKNYYNFIIVNIIKNVLIITEYEISQLLYLPEVAIKKTKTKTTSKKYAHLSLTKHKYKMCTNF